MQREIRVTGDGSHTIAIPAMNLTYHSHHGAMGESRHVFIEGGLLPMMAANKPPLRILEIGFGTGLNALLSSEQAIAQQYKLTYLAIEKFPVTAEEAVLLNHGQLLQMQGAFLRMHHSPWEQEICIHDYFSFKKMRVSLLEIPSIDPVHCIFFDAFAPTTQPELWTQAVFETMYRCLLPGGCLVTYSSKSEVRRAMTAAGFNVTKIPGPWGKREMVRAGKD
ncbi:MAG: hypothetical protein JWQ78_655 [Sediminibacterium sp.]|nr:hypothetical protein [Sediminibacterium sp.]